MAAILNKAQGSLAVSASRRSARAHVRASGLADGNAGKIWAPSSEIQMDIRSRLPHGQIVCSQGPPPPNPLVIERFQGVVSQLFQQRIVRLGGAVDDDMANLLVAQLLYLDSVDAKKDITMYVNSPGGSVTAGMAVFDTMRHIRPDVSTCCIGMAASMGAFILASGQQGKRYSLPNSRIMIHQPLGGAQGQATDIEIQANEILHHKLTLNGYLAQFSGQNMETITKDTDRDFFMSPQEAIEYGLIDAIIAKPQLLQSRDMAAIAAGAQ
uniref:ATP-dependent Clp protease proteolytic subunit n=1 Tax=Chlamydomonas leiostraca TaxID=1034604 RepID=A0A7S0R3K0_9CHLO|mmetsp:Transcript_13009/g.31853  ORF Transcript_13009/g.31853 Transcript_13009/m.31853 type:complete len:268 (+) Transcript_13009:69-872(+)|eukprot:CAMPEP_0202866492 /NCGR_PEP_ID=MMETSP1391-20130828/7731_1 /ASSEMBLY_ACC=CAM_ASM_000867 /TAXON_ID=1034604 /ORGANISM="Chlamydomonas leiostraca, Strain SAG 11-49" /LENGTH=267 /DNA_ID=CAMNT_0049546443 /DNA_START=54 /DNA_END=857 /DNA_ORIENTATION=+